jgi:threonine dehydratase/serine racemase
MKSYAISLGDVRAAAKRIAGQAHRTPVTTCRTLDRLAARELFFKCEQLQKVGAFKFRGACNAVLSLSDAAAARGVATHSSGNHAQALALAARTRGVAAHIVMPSTARAVKRRAVEGYGARIVECAPTLAAREATAAQVIEETGATFIHPYDQAEIMAGQGTVGLELLEQVGELDAIVAPAYAFSGLSLSEPMTPLAPSVRGVSFRKPRRKRSRMDCSRVWANSPGPSSATASRK